MNAQIDTPVWRPSPGFRRIDLKTSESHKGSHSTGYETAIQTILPIRFG